MNLRDYLKREKVFQEKLREIARSNQIPYFLLKWDCRISRLLDGANPAQYIAFQFYKLRGRERQSYITARKSAELEKVFNQAPPAEIELIGNKALFNKTFARFIKRDWLYAPEATEEELLSFLSQHEKILLKPVQLTQGQGIRLLCAEDTAQGPTAFYHKAQQDKLLLEAFLIQHEELSAVNPSSVNTVRICTVRDRAGEVHVIGASLRGGGAGSVVDNLHADGVQYPIDVESGLIIRGGVKFNGERDVYYHPSTGLKMIGLQIPNWELILDTVKEAGKVLPHIRYVGWDVAVTADGCELIEANVRQGSNGMQQDGVGKYRIIMQFR